MSVTLWLAAGRQRNSTGTMTVGVSGAEIPELDSGVGFAPGEKKVFATLREKAEGSDRNIAGASIRRFGISQSVPDWLGFCGARE